MTVNDVPVPRFGNMKISWKCSGIGASGVTSACFTFDVLLSDYPDHPYSIPGGAPVVLSCSGESSFSKIYYVSKAVPSENGIVSVTCYDRAIFTECDFPCTDEDFTDADGNEIQMDIWECLARIADICGLEGCLFPVDIIGQAEFKLSKSTLMGRSCHDVLNVIANALCGYWTLSNGGLERSEKFYLHAPGAENNYIWQTFSVYHEKIEYTSRLQIRSVLLTDCGYVYGGDTGGTDTIRIDTPAASLELYNALTDRLVGYTYMGFKCGNALLGDVPDFPAKISFEGEEFPLLCNYFDISLSSAGILASVGSNTVDAGAWKYIPKTRREIEQRYKEGETWENIEVTKKGGLKFVFVDENKKKQKYGFDVKENGLTAYDGNMIGKTPAKGLTVNDDATKMTYTVGDVKTELSVVWDGDNISSYSRRITDGDGKVIFNDE